jgi:hypothetical protein
MGPPLCIDFFLSFLKNIKISSIGGILKFFKLLSLGKFLQFWAIWVDYAALVVAKSMLKARLNSLKLSNPSTMKSI